MNAMKMDFRSLERYVYNLVVETFRELMSVVLQAIDLQLLVTRDKGRYRVHEQAEREVETLVGVIRFKRRGYWDQVERRWVYLLDEHLGLGRYERVGPGVVAVAVELAAMGTSYRGTRDQLAVLTGERVLSHEGIRQLVERTADVMKDDVARVVDRRRVQTLFIEADGQIVSIQRKKQQRKGLRGNKREVRQVVIHEGWRLRQGSRIEYELVNKRQALGWGSAGKFWPQVRQMLDQEYEGLDETLIVINGDGAGWIRAGVEYFGQAIYQYDRFHVSRAVGMATSQAGRESARAQSALSANDLGELRAALTASMSSCRTNRQRKELQQVKILVESQWPVILDYRIRLAAMGYDVSGWLGRGSGESTSAS